MVMQAASLLPSILPMMMTPSGTIKPAKVFVIGAGVAGLQAIATAKRLGANVLAYDTREVVAEQVESLGGKFLRIDIGETGQTKDGYAKELTEARCYCRFRHCNYNGATVRTKAPCAYFKRHLSANETW